MNHRMLCSQTENEPCCSHSRILSHLECIRPEAAARNQPHMETSCFSQYGRSFHSPQRCIAAASLETIPSSNPRPVQQTQRKYICSSLFSLIRLWDACTRRSCCPANRSPSPSSGTPTLSTMMKHRSTCALRKRTVTPYPLQTRKPLPSTGHRPGLNPSTVIPWW
jgi:hypothetical protein